MNEEDHLVGRCCKRNSEYLVHFNGNPSGNYAVYLCKHHFNQSPFNRNILKIIPIGES